MRWCDQCEEWVEPDGSKCPFCDGRLSKREQFEDDLDEDEDLALSDEPVIFGGKEKNALPGSEDESSLEAISRPPKRKKGRA